MKPNKQVEAAQSPGEELYVVVACERESQRRIAITDPASRAIAEHQRDRANATPSMRRDYKYFKVAKHPYSERPHGGGSRVNTTRG